MYRRLLDRRWLAVVLAFVALAAALASFLPPTFDASTNLLLDEHDPDLTYYSRSRRLWPSDDEFAIICCPPPAGSADWFTPEAVTTLGEIAGDAAKVPFGKRVVSLLDIPLLRSSGLILPPKIADKGVDLAKARTELTEHAVAKGTLISADGRDAVLLVYLEQPAEYERLDRERNTALETGDDARVAELAESYEKARAELRVRRSDLVAGVRGVAAKWSPRLTSPVRLSGLPVINLNLIEFVTHDVKVFLAVSFLVFVLAFAVIYRRVRWTALPIATCLLPVVLVLGVLGLLAAYPQLVPVALDRKFSPKLTVITANLPLLLFVIMLPYTVYFVERYRERRALAKDESHVDSTAGAARDIWIPCLYSCTTTIAGFASLLTSGVKPVWSFGFLMTIGLAVGLACAFLFLPAAARPLRALDEPGEGGAATTSGLVKALERCVLRAPVAVVLVAAILLGASVWGCTRITSENKFIDYFKPTSEVYEGLEYIDQHLGGTTPLDIVLTSEEPNFFRTPKGVAAIRAASAYIAAVPEVGSVTSLATLVDEARKAPRFAKATDWAIVAIGESISDLKPLLRDVATPDYTTSRILVRFRETSPTLLRKPILAGLRADLAGRTELTALTPRITGVFLLYANMLESLIDSQKDTFLAVVLAIDLMLLVLFSTPRLSRQIGGGILLANFWWLLGTKWMVAGAAACSVVALVAALLARRDRTLTGPHHALGLSVVVLLPQVLPAVVVLGVMGWAHVPLDLITVTIAAIAMGVGIDAAIQYTVRYRIELAATGGDRRAAVTRTHATIGRSIWIATTIMVVGFAVLALSDFVPTVSFGVFNALAMLMGQFAALTVLPALFLLTGLPRR